MLSLSYSTFLKQNVANRGCQIVSKGYFSRFLVPRMPLGINLFFVAADSHNMSQACRELVWNATTYDYHEWI